MSRIVQTNVLALLMIALPAIGLEGCSSRHTETVTTEQAPRYSYGEPVETRTETHFTVDHDEDHDRGFFHILGDIVALPFRAVGAVFEAIF